MTVGSLFSGIGGFDLGMIRAGHQVLWFCESDPFCRTILAKHWPTIPCYEDIRTLNADTVARPDCLIGGPPCQPVSHAGPQRGVKDDRFLWTEALALGRNLGCRYQLYENPPALLTIDGGRVFGALLGSLAQSGHTCEWRCLRASEFGAPHQRDRVWIVAYPHRTGLEGRAVLPERAGELPAWKGGVVSGFFDAPIERVWITEPRLGRTISHGVPKRVDRLKSLGNAVVPQMAEWLGERLTAHAEDPHADTR
jgi:DNA (cytosine-5)-methyltransferase 1